MKTPKDSYEYFSSNCCKVGQHVSGWRLRFIFCFRFSLIRWETTYRFSFSWQVLRSYDSRFRQTKRSPVIYQSQECNEILGGEVNTVLSLPAEGDSSAQSVATNDRGAATKSLSHDNDSFWNSMPRDRKLLVIATPYRPGSHTVTKPKGFVPILSELRKLHDKGFVHGDIRAFNTVFNEEDSEGYLIDFDYGGRKNEARYPKGYRWELKDGHRLGSEGNNIEPWHDWYALGQLIFARAHISIP